MPTQICQVSVARAALSAAIAKDVDFNLKNNCHENFLHQLAKVQSESASPFLMTFLNSFYENLLKKYTKEWGDKALLKLENLVNALDSDGFTPLALAILNKNPPLVQTFLKLGAFLDVSFSERVTDKNSLAEKINLLFEVRKNLPEGQVSCKEIDEALLALLDNVDYQLVIAEQVYPSLPLLAVATNHLKAIEFLQAVGANFGKNPAEPESFSAFEASIHLGLADIFF